MSEIQKIGQKQDSEAVSLLDIMQERTQTVNKVAYWVLNMRNRIF